MSRNLIFEYSDFRSVVSIFHITMIFPKGTLLVPGVKIISTYFKMCYDRHTPHGILHVQTICAYPALSHKHKNMKTKL
jgi:hypothetical protein